MAALITTTLMSNNASIIFISDTYRVILVRDSRDGIWMLPGGKRDGDETDFECALREFREETSLLINPTYFISIQSEIRIHTNGSKTNIFIIRSTQRFPDYDASKVLNSETDALLFLQLKDLKKIVNGAQHKHVTKLKDYIIRSLSDLFTRQII